MQQNWKTIFFVCSKDFHWVNFWKFFNGSWISTLNTRVDITFSQSWYLMRAIPKFFFSMELHLFPFLLKFMCLNGVVVEVKWENLKFSPIDFFYFYSNGDLKWISIGSTTLIIQWLQWIFFGWICIAILLQYLSFCYTFNLKK
jgi:hypothetical protein